MTKIRPPKVRYVWIKDAVAVPKSPRSVDVEYSEVEPRHIWEEEIGEEAARYATREE